MNSKEASVSDTNLPKMEEANESKETKKPEESDLQFHLNKVTDSKVLFSFLKQSFPDLPLENFQRIIMGKHFIGWFQVFREDTLIGTAAIFDREDHYKFGLFCIAPEERRKGIGKKLFMKIADNYFPVVWDARTEESIMFYQKLGAEKIGTVKIKGHTCIQFRFPPCS